ncbi:unnamed protein product [Amoebophrya sp. A120]|nr:unnamed protein product [Amoebophrya sp. A120]|eukprot:GSA120T00018837001.1
MAGREQVKALWADDKDPANGVVFRVNRNLHTKKITPCSQQTLTHQSRFSKVLFRHFGSYRFLHVLVRIPDSKRPLSKENLEKELQVNAAFDYGMWRYEFLYAVPKDRKFGVDKEESSGVNDVDVDMDDAEKNAFREHFEGHEHFQLTYFAVSVSAQMQTIVREKGLVVPDPESTYEYKQVAPAGLHVVRNTATAAPAPHSINLDVLQPISILDVYLFHSHNNMNNLRALISSSKVLKRFRLLLTDTIPTVTVPGDCIQVVPDRVTQDPNYPKEPGVIGNDGHGLIGYELAVKVASALGLEKIPTTFQARFAGVVKGMFTVSAKAENKHKLLISRTQLKVTDVDWRTLTDAQRVLEIKDWSSARVNPLKNGLPHQVSILLEALAYRSGTAEKLEKFLQDQERSRVKEVEDLFSGVSADGRERLGEKGELEKQLLAALPRSKLCDADTRTLRELLQGGWPLSAAPFLPIAAIAHFQKNVMATTLNNEKLHVPDCYCVFVIADEDGVLEPGEAIFRRNGTAFAGDILATRVPANVISDVQRYRCLGHTEIHARWRDKERMGISYETDNVLVLSSTAFTYPGQLDASGVPRRARAPVDLSSGGDMDGDKFYVICCEAVTSLIPQAVQYTNTTDILRARARTLKQQQKCAPGQPASTSFTIAADLSATIRREMFSAHLCSAKVGQLYACWKSTSDRLGAGDQYAEALGWISQEALDQRLTRELEEVVLIPFATVLDEKAYAQPSYHYPAKGTAEETAATARVRELLLPVLVTKSGEEEDFSAEQSIKARIWPKMLAPDWDKKLAKKAMRQQTGFQQDQGSSAAIEDLDKAYDKVVNEHAFKSGSILGKIHRMMRYYAKHDFCLRCMHKAHDFKFAENATTDSWMVDSYFSEHKEVQQEFRTNRSTDFDTYWKKLEKRTSRHALPPALGYAPLQFDNSSDLLGGVGSQSSQGSDGSAFASQPLHVVGGTNNSENHDQCVTGPAPHPIVAPPVPQFESAFGNGFSTSSVGERDFRRGEVKRPRLAATAQSAPHVFPVAGHINTAQFRNPAAEAAAKTLFPEESALDTSCAPLDDTLDFFSEVAAHRTATQEEDHPMSAAFEGKSQFQPSARLAKFCEWIPQIYRKYFENYEVLDLMKKKLQHQNNLNLPANYDRSNAENLKRRIREEREKILQQVEALENVSHRTAPMDLTSTAAPIRPLPSNADDLNRLRTLKLNTAAVFYRVACEIFDERRFTKASKGEMPGCGWTKFSLAYTKVPFLMFQAELSAILAASSENEEEDCFLVRRGLL